MALKLLAFEGEVNSPRKGDDLVLCGDARSRRAPHERPAANVSAGIWQASLGMDPVRPFSSRGTAEAQPTTQGLKG